MAKGDREFRLQRQGGTRDEMRRNCPSQSSESDHKHRTERLESCMHRKMHVQFGGGPMEKDMLRTSPAAYPTRSSPNFAVVC